MFVSPMDNVSSEKNESKTETASKNIDKGKSILGAPPKIDKKESRNPRIKEKNNKSLNKRSHISVITTKF